jgi:hypothetical protein
VDVLTFCSYPISYCLKALPGAEIEHVQVEKKGQTAPGTHTFPHHTFSFTSWGLPLQSHSHSHVWLCRIRSWCFFSNLGGIEAQMQIDTILLVIHVKAPAERTMLALNFTKRHVIIVQISGRLIKGISCLIESYLVEQRRTIGIHQLRRNQTLLFFRVCPCPKAPFHLCSSHSAMKFWHWVTQTSGMSTNHNNMLMQVQKDSAKQVGHKRQGKVWRWSVLLTALASKKTQQNRQGTNWKVESYETSYLV